MTFNSVNAASTTRDKMDEILKHTGFSKGEDGPMKLGKWFREDDFGLPSFISKRSLQRNCTEDLEGWTFNKNKNYPDIWIDPKDSVVLTVKCAEIVVSVSFSSQQRIPYKKLSLCDLNILIIHSVIRKSIRWDFRCDFLGLKKSV